MKKKILLAAAAGFIGLLLLALAVLLLIPGEFMKNLAVDFVEKNSKMTLHVEEFRKVFPLGVEAKGLEIRNAWGEGGKGTKAARLVGEESTLHIDRLRARVSLLRVIFGEVRVFASGTVAEGTVSLRATLKGERALVEMHVKDIAMRGLGPLKDMGLSGEGIMEGEGSLVFSRGTCPEGSLNFKGRNVDLDGFQYAAAGMLFGKNVDFTLAMDYLPGCRASIRNLWVEGNDIKGRLYGDIVLREPLSSTTMALTAELLPERELAGKNGILAALSNYRRSSNHYRMQIGGSLQRPVVTR